MSGSLLTNLPAASAVGGADLVYMVQSGADKKATAAQIATFTAGGLLRTSATLSANGLIGTVPATGAILMIALQETAGHNVDCSLGTSSGGSQLMAATTIVGSAAPLLIPTFSLLPPYSWVADQGIFLNSASWGLSSVIARMWVVS